MVSPEQYHPETEQKLAELKQEKSRRDFWVKKENEVRFPGLSWGAPRDTRDFLMAYVTQKEQLGDFTDPPIFVGLFNDQEKSAYTAQQEESWRAWEESVIAGLPTPQERKNNLIENRWKKFEQSPQAGVSGGVFFSKAFKDAGAKEKYLSDDNEGRVSFSINLAKADQFFDLMMVELSTGTLRDVPVKLKMADIRPGQQGKGEDAHLYFKAEDQEKVYTALIDSVYPALQKNNLTALGGRFMMIPVQDRNGQVLSGIEFGQGMRSRQEIKANKREQTLQNRNGALATSDIMHVVTMFVENSSIKKNLGRYQRLLAEGGQDALFADGEFSKFYSSDFFRFLAELGRDVDYPILDRDGKSSFPEFTKAISSMKK